MMGAFCDLPPRAILQQRVAQTSVHAVARDYGVTTRTVQRHLYGHIPDRAAQTLPGADPSWMDQAACAGSDVDTFHADKGGGAPHAARRALAMCARCPVVDQCLAYILAVEDPGARAGIWGGTTANERKRLGRQEAAA